MPSAVSEPAQRTSVSVFELIAPAAFMAGIEIARVLGVDHGVLLGGCAAAIAIGAWRLARSGLGRNGLARGIAAIGLVSLAIALAPLALGAPAAGSASAAAVPVLAMLASTAWLRWTGPEPAAPRAPAQRLPSIAWLWISLAVFAALVVAGNRLIIGNYPEVPDEASYMLQAGWMWMPGFSWHFDPALEDFFTERHLVDRPGQLATLYPPGWPMVFALFDAVGLGFYWGLFAGSLTVLAVWRIGVLLDGPRTAALAAVLLACSQWIVDSFASYMAHGATMMFAVTGAWAMLEAEGRTGRRRVLLLMLAGALLSCAVASRPLTGVALGTGIVLSIWFRRRAPMWDRMRSAVCLTVGALPGLAGLLYYNAQTTGSPFLFGYGAAYGSMQSLGFGQRGWMVYDEALRRVPAADEFTPYVAVMRRSHELADAAMTFVPLFAFAPMLLAARQAGVRLQVRAWLPLLLLPAAYFCYFFRGVRFWVEAVPFLLLGVAWLLVRISDRAPAIGRQLVAMTLIGQVAFFAYSDEGAAPLRPYTERPWSRNLPGSAARVNFAAIDRLREQHGKLLIFAREVGPGFAPLRDRLMFYNARGESSDVLVARDLGDRNAELMRRHPDRTPFLVTRTSSNGQIPATITPLPRVH